MIPTEFSLHTTVSVTTAELNDFLRERDAERPCEACGKAVEWFMRTHDGKPLLTYSPFYSTPSSADLHFTLFCPNCGNTRVFNAMYVAAIIKSGGEHGNG